MSAGWPSVIATVIAADEGAMGIIGAALVSS
jgi:hypothetical protein